MQGHGLATPADGGGAALQRNSSLPWPTSTRTYPQSVFSALPGVSDSVRVAVAETLFRWEHVTVQAACTHWLKLHHVSCHRAHAGGTFWLKLCACCICM